MQKLTHVIGALFFILQSSLLNAKTLSPYKVDFNIEISTTEHDFAVGSSWRHIVDSYNDGYPRYTYHKDGGVDNSGYLEIGSQTMIDWDDNGAEHDVNDMLVTPAITGELSIFAKLTNSWSQKAGVKFYKVTFSNDKYTLGEEVTPQTYSVNSTNFTKVILPSQPAGTHIAIRGHSVAIDNLQATAAEVEVKRAISIVGAEWAGSKYADCDAHGNYQITYNVKVRNTGDVSLQPDEEGYSVSLFRATNDSELVTVPINQTLAPGEISNDITLSATLNTATDETIVPYIKENLSNSTASLSEVTPSPYEKDIILTGAYGTHPLLTGYRIEYGTSRNDVTVKFLLRNTGAQPQQVTEITTTPGFKASLTGSHTVAGHDNLALSVTMTPDVLGEKHGHLTVKTAMGGEVILNLNGYTVSDEEMFYDFEEEKVPEGFVTDNEWFLSTMPTHIYSINNKTCMTNESSKGAFLVLPKMHVKAGDNLTVELSKMYNESYVDVYYSSERHDWKLLRSIKGTEMSDSALAKSWTGNYYAFTKFSIDNVPTGKWYIGFKSGCAFLDNIVTDFSPITVEHDGFFHSMEGPVQAEVNKTFSVKSSFVNILNHVEPGDNYQVAYYLDDECVATALPEELSTMGYRTFSLLVTPHTAGIKNGYWKYTAGDIIIISDTTKIDVKPENATQENLTHELKHHYYANTTPFDPYNFNGESEAIYTREELNLPAGTAINAISWYGSNIGISIDVKAELYLQNTSEEVIALNADKEFEMTDRSKMTRVFAGTTTLEKVGSATNYERLMTIALEKPFIYEGGNLRLGFRGSVTTGTRVFFAATLGVFEQNRSIDRNNTNENQLATTSIYHDALPVIGVTYKTNVLKVTGKVTDKDTHNPIANASILLTNGEVLYGAVTSGDGSYELNVFKTDRNYAVSASADRYQPSMGEIIFNDKDVTLDFMLSSEVSGINDNVIDKEQNFVIYSIDGKRLTRLQRGLNIIRMQNGNTRKVFVK